MTRPTKTAPASTSAGRGGSRKGAGGTVSQIDISKEHAKTLRTLLKLRPGGAYSREEVIAWVEAQIDAAWEAYDAEIRKDVEEAEQWEGEIL